MCDTKVLTNMLVEMLRMVNIFIMIPTVLFFSPLCSISNDSYLSASTDDDNGSGGNRQRGLPYMTSAKCSDFFTPPPK